MITTDKIRTRDAIRSAAHHLTPAEVDALGRVATAFMARLERWHATAGTPVNDTCPLCDGTVRVQAAPGRERMTVLIHEAPLCRLWADAISTFVRLQRWPAPRVLSRSPHCRHEP